MGGQACVFYGAAEFSRDTDIVIAMSATNLRRLRAALTIISNSSMRLPRSASNSGCWNPGRRNGSLP